ncbi:uncharacterized protein LOC142559297 [Dermacentor variabilis]|uniref:uncharacterized protein LOC142559297 n=1 Tax=Dermacentor variabilis TaxID=34621 RepID=UPI003F5B5B32
MESWKVALKNKFKNNRKKAVNKSTEMQAVRAQSYRKSPREPVVEVANKKLCRLSDNNDLIIYGETLESRQKHNEWLQENFATADPEDLRPRLLATAKERHECLRRITLSEALLQYPFLATEHSLLMEFNILFKRTILDSIEHGCSRLCSIILDHAEQDEVVRFSAMASEDGVLGVLNFIAGRCNESLDAILTETAAVPLTPCLQRASDGSLALHIDAQRLFVTSSLLAGLACLFASFWAAPSAAESNNTQTLLSQGCITVQKSRPETRLSEPRDPASTASQKEMEVDASGPNCRLGTRCSIF